MVCMYNTYQPGVPFTHVYSVCLLDLNVALNLKKIFSFCSTAFSNFFFFAILFFSFLISFWTLISLSLSFFLKSNRGAYNFFNIFVWSLPMFLWVILFHLLSGSSYFAIFVLRFYCFLPISFSLKTENIRSLSAYFYKEGILKSTWLKSIVFGLME